MNNINENKDQQNELLRNNNNINEKQNISNDERDEMIKNEPGTARIRSERQSVIDGEKDRQDQHNY